jgi:hypothetical protein
MRFRYIFPEFEAVSQTERDVPFMHSFQHMPRVLFIGLQNPEAFIMLCRLNRAYFSSISRYAREIKK